MNINQSQRCSSKPIKWKQLIVDFNELADCFDFLSGPYSHGGHIVPRDWKKLCFYHSRPRSEKLWSEAGQVKQSYISLSGQNGRRASKAHNLTSEVRTRNTRDEINRKKKTLLTPRVTILWLAKAKISRNFSRQIEISHTQSCSHTISAIENFSESRQVTITVRGSYHV